MTSEMHEQQAAQFVDWHQRRGGAWEDSFAVWADSKDLMPRDALAIRAIAHELLTSENVSVDVFDFLRIAPRGA